MTEKHDEREERTRRSEKPWLDHFNPSLTLGKLAVIAFAIGIGGVGVLLAQNAGGEESLEFSTVGLIGVLFSVAIGGAAIVLAISAIGLGRASEQTMTDRSDESIRLQNEVFKMTTEALQRIESSTGVTEKRIEDIISGNVGDISERVAAGLTSGTFVAGRSKENLEEEIRDSILQEVSEERNDENRQQERSQALKARKAREELIERDHTFRDTVLRGLINSQRFQVERLEGGWFHEPGDEAMDGILTLGGERIGFSVNTTERLEDDIRVEMYAGFINGIGSSIADGLFQQAFLVYDEDMSEDSDHQATIDSARRLIRNDVVSRIHVVFGEPAEVTAKVMSMLESEVPPSAPSAASDSIPSDLKS
ncbi:MAG: hypothetical protein IH865_12540 [Chloroflexi bacterium]|nr:hypothetical protein [Chloroflexota bacterium]